MNKITTLWFSNTPCGSVRKNNMLVNAGGWMISLEDEIKKYPEIDLNVAFFSNKIETPYEYDDVRYYPMYKPEGNTKLGRIMERYKPKESIDRKMIPVMIDVVKTVHPDLIHIHGTEERFGLIQDYIKDIPIVFSIQGLIAPYSEKYFSGFPKQFIENNENRVDIIRGVSEINYYRNALFRAQREIHYLKNARYVIGRTFWDKSITYLFNSQRKYFEGNEIMRSEFYDSKWKYIPKKNKISIISTISPGPYKGIETLLKSANLLKQFMHVPFEWNVIGLSNKDKWVIMAEKLTHISGSSCCVNYCGRKTSEEMIPLMLGSDVYCHVSHIENSPNSVCEAMLLGMPIVASFAGGTSTILENQQEGILVQDGEPYIMASSILFLLDNPDIANEFALSAYKKAHCRHKREIIGSQLIDIYKEIIEDYDKMKLSEII